MKEALKGTTLRYRISAIGSNQHNNLAFITAKGWAVETQGRPISLIQYELLESEGNLRMVIPAVKQIFIEKVFIFSPSFYLSTHDKQMNECHTIVFCLRRLFLNGISDISQMKVLWPYRWKTDRWLNSGVVSDVHHNLLLAKACPEPDLRYRSNSMAFDSSEKAR